MDVNALWISLSIRTYQTHKNEYEYGAQLWHDMHRYLYGDEMGKYINVIIERTKNGCYRSGGIKVRNLWCKIVCVESVESM